jgi:hypothetical protein
LLSWEEEKVEEDVVNGSPTSVEIVSEVIQDKFKKDQLIHAIVAVRGDFIQKIHFCSCVFQWADMGTEEKVDKGNRIIELFLADAAQFPCRGVKLS